MNREMDAETKAHLQNQLVKLGDMLGDGDCDPWVAKEYRQACKALGYTRPRANNSKAINEAMAKALAETRCPKCNGELKQTRSGSKRAQCIGCQAKVQFGKAKGGK